MKNMAQRWETTVRFEPLGDYFQDNTWPNKLHTIWYYVLSDHPEIFWYGTDIHFGYEQMGGRITAVNMTVHLTVTADRKTATENEINAAVLDILNEIRDVSGEYNVTKALYEKIVLGTQYNLNSPELIHTSYAVLCKNVGVCDGYTKAFQYLLNYRGIRSIFVWGNAYSGGGGSERHAWCLVENENDWYQCDVTWGDPRVEDLPVNYITYSYLNITDEEMFTNHEYLTVQETDSDTVMYEVPECDSTACNYFIKEGAYITDYTLEDTTAYLAQIIKAQAVGDSWSGIAEVRFSDAAWTLFCEDQSRFGGRMNAALTEEEIDFTNFKIIKKQIFSLIVWKT